MLRSEVYVPFSIQEVLVGIRYADADVILAIANLLDLDITRAERDDNDFLVSRTVVFVVNTAGCLALSTITVTDTAPILRSFGIYSPITTDFLKIGITQSSKSSFM